jgi:pyruvate/2-oxoglutarate dehydrogenase complex dihydrolipoamide acyltransferase (E2) component
MPTPRARLLGQPLAVIVIAAAAAVGACTGVGYAATRALAAPAASAATPAAAAAAKSAPATPLVWHQLTLLNGWVSAASWGTGAPEYAVSPEGVVYFAGSLKDGNQNKAAFVMPAGTRPGFYDCFAVFSNDSTNVQVVGAFHIFANGKAYLQGPSAAFFSSLSGISYVVGH